jgi:hypothetical protein
VREIQGLGTVLHLPRLSDSIYYRPWFDTSGDQTVLQWFVDWFGNVYNRKSLAILVHSERDCTAINKILSAKIGRVFRPGHSALSLAFAEVAGALGSEHFAFFGLGMCFAPIHLLAKAYDHHVNRQNDCIFVSGFPIGATPEIYTSKFLRDLSGVDLLASSASPREVPRRIVEISQQSSTVDIRPPRCEFFDAIVEYSADPAVIPRTLDLQTRARVEIGRRVVDLLKPAGFMNCSLEPLSMWKRINITERRARGSLVKAAECVQPGSHSNEPIRVLYVSNCSAHSGAQESLCRIVPHIDRRSFKLSALVGMEGCFAQKLREHGVTVVCPGRDFALPTIENFLFCQSVLGEVNPQIIHINDFPETPPICAAVGRPNKLVYHVRVTELDPPFRGPAFECGRDYRRVAVYEARGARTRCRPQ